MKIFLSGQKSFGFEVLLMLIERGIEITGVAAPRAPDGRADKLFAYAEFLGLKTVDAAALRAEDIAPGTDLIVCAHSHAFVGRKTRQAARLGAIGYHPSLLPRHRGRDAVKWAIKMKDAVTGGTVYWLDDRIDGGDIAAQAWCWIHPKDTASTLWKDKLFPLGLALLDKTIGDIENKKIVRIKQDEAVATFEPALNPPRLFRPELPQLTDGTGGLMFSVESELEQMIGSL
jgi:methionyl-tRNA formyltransferase